MSASVTEIGLEIGRKRVFAWALEWPGWCRSAKTEDEAIEQLAIYAERYAAALRGSRISFSTAAAGKFTVVESVKGDATTDFGAPHAIAPSDHATSSGTELKRMAKILDVTWKALDDVAERSSAILAKGPRGGGRDRDDVLQHVLNVEAAYARKLGVKVKAADMQNREQVAFNRTAIADYVCKKSTDDDRPWPTRYAVRRIVWHTLDHAWEIEDKKR